MTPDPPLALRSFSEEGIHLLTDPLCPELVEGLVLSLSKD